LEGKLVAYKRTSVYLSNKNKELIRRLGFWERKTHKDVLNDTLLEALTKKLEKYEKLEDE
jgi:hypothetical protein